MVTRIHTVAFQGIETLPVEVQVHLGAGLPAFTIVGLPDKAVAESRERVRAALASMGVQLPAKRILVNLAPADVQKEGSHFDVPIALGLLVALGMIPADALEGFVALGELALDGQLQPVAGVPARSIGGKRAQQGHPLPRGEWARSRLRGGYRYTGGRLAAFAHQPFQGPANHPPPGSIA